MRMPEPVDVLVTGRSLPALLAALEFAEVGLSVAIASATIDSDEASGRIAGSEDAERDPDGEIRSLMTRIDAPIVAKEHSDDEADVRTAPEKPADSPIAPLTLSPRPPRLRDDTGRWALQPAPAVFGIPAVPLSRESLRLLGTGGGLRAYLDRIAPLLTIGKTKSFGRLVRGRLGAKALKRLVDPQIRERFGVGPNEVDVAIATPGLNEALSRAGSLTSAALAYSERFAKREALTIPRGGWAALEGAILHRLSAYGVTMLDGTVTTIVAVEGDVNAPAEGMTEAAGGSDVVPGDTATTAWSALLTGGVEASARAVVLDLGDGPDAPLEPEPENPGFDLTTARAAYTRIYAEIDIEAVSFAKGLDDADEDALLTVAGWSLRLAQREIPGSPGAPASVDSVGVERHDAERHSTGGHSTGGHSAERRDTSGHGSERRDTRWVARIGGPRMETSSTASAIENIQSTLESVLAAAEVDPTEGATWSWWLRAAPFCTVQDRNAASDGGPASDDATILPVGRSLHGDDLGAALSSARTAAIDVRRRLLGLAE